MIRYLIPLLFLVHISGCAEEPPYPTCQLDQAVFEGEIDGEFLRYEFNFTGHSWLNFGSYKLKTFGDEGSIEFEWSKTIAHDDSDTGSGWFEVGSVKIGTCDTNEASSTIVARDGGADFVLENLYQNADCNDQALEGVLYGCVRF
jgi:hypothetical protein